MDHAQRAQDLFYARRPCLRLVGEAAAALEALLSSDDC